MNVIQEINNVNDKFATQGSKLKIEKRGEKLNIRGSLPAFISAIADSVKGCQYLIAM